MLIFKVVMANAAILPFNGFIGDHIPLSMPLGPSELEVALCKSSGTYVLPHGDPRGHSVFSPIYQSGNTKGLELRR